MICISRCPYRISLLGGGSDLDWFVEKEGYGISLGYSLSKYSYTVVNKLPKNISRGILNYSSREEYFDADEIAHPLIRSALKYFSPPLSHFTLLAKFLSLSSMVALALT